jgi:hypothetical protein
MKLDRKRMNALGGRGMYDASRRLLCPLLATGDVSGEDSDAASGRISKEVGSVL